MDNSWIEELNKPTPTIPIDFDLNKGWQDFDSRSQIAPISYPAGKQPIATLASFYTKQGEFYWHRHNTTETCIVYGQVDLYEGERKFVDGRWVMVVTSLRSLGPGDTFKVDAGVYHKVVFKEDMIIILGWYPMFEDNVWKGEFTQDEEGLADLGTQEMVDKLRTAAENIFRNEPQ